ncbi:MAG: preprotein translocase subunit SecG [Woeseia sp.]
MNTLQTAVLIGHTLIAILIIVLVLIQRGKGADAGAAFGGGASGTVFGARGSSSFFSRMTAVLATAFFATSLTLAYMSSQRAEAPTSLIETAPIVDESAAPAVNEVPELPTLDPADEAAVDMPSLESSDETLDPQ